MILTYKYKLRPTAAQHGLLAARLERQRILYNAALEERCQAWRLAKKSISYLNQQKSLTAIRTDDAEGHGADPVDMGRWTLRRLDEAFAGFFRRVRNGQKPGFPRFRGVGRWRSFGLAEANGIRITNGRLYLKGLRRGIRINRDRALPEDADLRSVVFTRSNGHWIVSLIIQTSAVPSPAHGDGVAVGIDLGVEALVTTSEGVRVPNVTPGKRRARAVRVAQRALARCRKESRRRKKVRATLARHLRAVANARLTHLHQVSARLAREYPLIAVEKLSIVNMTRSAAGTIAEPGVGVAQKSGLNRAILDAAWGELVRQIGYKAVRAGGRMVCVDPRHTSQDCSACGARVPKVLAERHHACGHCGYNAHRDVNAARNILARGLAASAASEGGRPLGDANVGHRAVRRPVTLLGARKRAAGDLSARIILA